MKILEDIKYPRRLEILRKKTLLGGSQNSTKIVLDISINKILVIWNEYTMHLYAP